MVFGWLSVMLSNICINFMACAGLQALMHIAQLMLFGIPARHLVTTVCALCTFGNNGLILETSIAFVTDDEFYNRMAFHLAILWYIIYIYWKSFWSNKCSPWHRGHVMGICNGAKY